MKAQHYLTALFLLLAHSSPATADDSQPTPPLRIYSWQDYGVEGVTPMIWVSPMYGHDAKPAGKTYHDARDPVVEARRVAIRLAAAPPGGRVLFLKSIGEQSDGLLTGVGVAEAWEDGARAEPTRRWCRAFFSALRDRGVEALDYVVLDYEVGIGYWSLGDGAKAAEALRGAGPRANVPAVIRKATREDFDRMRPELMAAFNDRGGRIVDEALERAVAGPLREFYPEAPCSNYNFFASARPTVDPNGWPVPPRPLTFGTHSSPVLYNWHGQRARRAGLDDAQSRRLAWLDDRQLLRACLAAGVPLAPWYAPPRYCGDGNAAYADREAWADALRCDVQAGVRVILLWGDAGRSDDPLVPARWGPRDVEALRRLVPELRALASDGPIDPALARRADGSEE